MKKCNFVLLLLLSFLSFSCTKPGAHVYKDDSLKQQETAKFCFLGDVGLDSPVQKQVALALESEKCDRIFFLGDLVYEEGISSINDPELETKFLSYYDPLLEASPSLQIGLILGNHDYAGNPLAWLDIDKKNPRYFFPNSFYMVDYGELCILALDTNLWVEDNSLVKSVDQSAWLTTLQPKFKKCEVKIAISHHPYKGDEFDGSEDWEGAKGAMKTFFDTWIIGKVDLHIAGHVHVLEEDGRDEGTRLFVSGAGGEIRGTESTPGFLVVNWQPGSKTIH